MPFRWACAAPALLRWACAAPALHEPQPKTTRASFDANAATLLLLWWLFSSNAWDIAPQRVFGALERAFQSTAMYVQVKSAARGGMLVTKIKTIPRPWQLDQQPTRSGFAR